MGDIRIVTPVGNLSFPDGTPPDEIQRAVEDFTKNFKGGVTGEATTPEGSSLGRFAEGAWKNLNPANALDFLGNVAQGLMPTQAGADARTAVGKAVIDPSVDQLSQAVAAYKAGDPLASLGHAAGAVPIIGPALAHAVDTAKSGNVAGGLGEGVGLAAPFLAGPAADMAMSGAKTLAPGVMDSLANAADRMSVDRMADVMSPKVGANKVRFANKAADVAPALARDAELGAFSRQGLLGKVEGRLEEAQAGLDAAADARGNTQAFPTKPIISALLDARRRLTAEAVDASRIVPQVEGAPVRQIPIDPVRQYSLHADDIATGRLDPRHVMQTSGPTPAPVADAHTLSLDGKPGQMPAMSGRPIGQDVVPSPNAARVAQIDKAISEVKALGPMARYESLRRIRQAYDGPAKAVYSPSMTADYMAKQGEKLGAADVTSALRDSLARFDPATAEANAKYSVYKSANDVLQAAEETDRARPRVGRGMVARATGAMIGAKEGGVTGAAVGAMAGAMAERAAQMAPTFQIAIARRLARVADLLRTGDVAAADTAMQQAVARFPLVKGGLKVTGKLSAPAGNLGAALPRAAGGPDQQNP